MSKEDFSRYGKDFQESLCHLVLVDRPFADQIFEVLDVDFLELKYLQVFVKLIKNYREKYPEHPSEDRMKAIVRTEISEELESVQTRVRDFLARIYRADIDGSDYVKATALDFCRKQNLKKAMLKSVKLLEDHSFDEISSVINEAIVLGSDSNFGHDYVKDFEQRFLLSISKPQLQRPVGMR